jgi:hypothetical protein
MNLKVGGQGGTKISEETRVKLSGANNHFYGKHHSEESKQKIREANKGKCRMSEEAFKIRYEKSKEKYINAIAVARQSKLDNLVLTTYTLKSLDNEVLIIQGYENLKQYGNPDMLSKVSRGLKKSYKGWSKP